MTTIETTDSALTEKDLAKRWNVSVRIIQKWRRENVGPVFHRIGKATVRYFEKDVRAYEEQCLNQPKTEET